MRHMPLRRAALSVATLAALAMPVLLPGVASAHTPNEHTSAEANVQAKLRPVPTNTVDGKGKAAITLDGNTAQVTVRVKGLLDGAPHAMHIHVKGNGECPTEDAASRDGDDRSISTADGLPDYGAIGTSLTASGDTSPDSALAVERFPSIGTFRYERSIDVTDEVAQAIRSDNAVIVVHGIDYNDNGTYDDVLGASELDPSLPQEATAPALCGNLH